MTLLSTLLASAVVPPAAIALVLIALLVAMELVRWQQARPRFAPIFVRTTRPAPRSRRRDDSR